MNSWYIVVYYESSTPPYRYHVRGRMSSADLFPQAFDIARGQGVRKVTVEDCFQKIYLSVERQL